MFGEKNSIVIGKNATENTVYQNSTVTDTTNNHIYTSNKELLQLLSQAGQYEVLQKYIANEMQGIKETHPLYPDFEASYDNEIGRLVSKATSTESYKKHPLNIKTKVIVHREKYPDMDQSETPWDYATRTQTAVEVEPLDYAEYLGDVLDPYPTNGNGKVVSMIIYPYEFPEAVPARIESGNERLNFMYRRLPYKKYGYIYSGNTTHEMGLDIRILYNYQEKKLTWNLTLNDDTTLENLYRRESFLNQVYETKQIKLFVQNAEVATIDLSDQEYDIIGFHSKWHLKLIENLIRIQLHYNCKFDLCEFSSVSYDDYVQSCVLVSSLTNNYHLHRMKLEELEDFPKNLLPEDESILTANNLEMHFTVNNYMVTILGITFQIESFENVYNRCRIKNTDEIKISSNQDNERIRMVLIPNDEGLLNHFMKFNEITISAS